MSSDVKVARVTATGTLVNSRARLKGIVYTADGDDTLTFKDGGGSGTTILTLLARIENGVNDIYIPDDGVLFETDIHVTIAGSNVPDITIFYTG